MVTGLGQRGAFDPGSTMLKSMSKGDNGHRNHRCQMLSADACHGLGNPSRSGIADDHRGNREALAAPRLRERAPKVLDRLKTLKELRDVARPAAREMTDLLATGDAGHEDFGVQIERHLADPIAIRTSHQFKQLPRRCNR